MAGRRSFGSVRRMRGRWQARYHDRAGRRRSRVFATKADANAHLAAVQADLMRGQWFDPDAGRETLAAYAATWLERRRVRGRPLAPRTRDSYAAQLRLRILPVLGDRQLRHLDPAAVRGWWATMSDRGIGAAKCYRLLHAICESAVREELIPRNPCVIPGAGQEHSPERPAVTVPEMWALADAVGERWRAVVLLAAFCGLRWGEIAALTRADVDLDLHKRITVERDLDELDSGKVQPGRVKSAAGHRTVAIPEVMVPDLKRHLDTWARPGPDGLVFVGVRGGLLRRSTFRRAVWGPARNSIHRPDLHFHDLRGCAATLAAISGATTAELMRRLGHATPGVAMRYQRATADRDAAVAQLMSDLVRPAEVTPLRPTAEKR